MRLSLIKNKESRISIHALRGEGDRLNPSQNPQEILISIHALRGEGDIRAKHEYAADKYFNPRPPWGGRQSLKEPLSHLS